LPGSLRFDCAQYPARPSRTVSGPSQVLRPAAGKQIPCRTSEAGILNKMLHTSLRTLVNTYRIDASKQLLLRKKNIGILQAAFQCGFNSENAFNTAFHEQEGVNRAKFREKSKKTRHGL
jgi:hypothetical protein